jgi:hypothetical protein
VQLLQLCRQSWLHDSGTTEPLPSQQGNQARAIPKYKACPQSLGPIRVLLLGWTSGFRTRGTQPPSLVVSAGSTRIR